MKRIILCLLAAATAVACSKDETSAPAGDPKDLVLTFGAETTEAEAGDDVAPGPSVRAGYDGAKSIWHAGDAVSLSFDATNRNLQFTQVAGSLSPDATKVQYTGTLQSPVTGNVTCVAYYPYSASATVSGSTITTTFPATQPYVAAGYKGIPLFSTYTGDIKALKLNFKNLYSVVKLTLVKGSALTNPVKLQQIVFKGNNNETVSGAMVVNMSGSTPSVSYTGSGKTVTLDMGAGVTLTTVPQTFYIAVPAINYTRGYSFTFITDNGQVTKSAKNTGASYAVNKIYAAPSLTIDNLTIVSAIPDGNLRNALADLGLISILDALTGKVSITTAGLQAVSLNLSGKNIADLTGLSNFPALVSLSAGNNNLTSVDLSKLTLLTNLDLSRNQLTGLNLLANTALLSLNVASNNLTSLNVAANTLLTSLNVSTNQLSSLNLASNLALLSLDASSNLLTSLDLHNNILLTSLKIDGNSLVTLNISGLKALLTLNLVNGVNSVNVLTKTLTIPAAATVQNLISDGVALTNWLNFVCVTNPNLLSISLKNNTGLLTVSATGNTKLASLDVSGNLTLNNVNCNSNALTSLNLTGDIAVTALNCASNKLPTLNLAGQTALLTLDASSNLLTSLDLHNNILLTSAKVYRNTLTTLNISGLVALLTLQLDATGTNCISLLKLTIPVGATVANLIANNASAAVNWTVFDCTGNPNIITISLQNNLLLTAVTARNNTKLTSLNVKGCLVTLIPFTSGNAAGFSVTGPL